jgi:prepilin-type N-terminal cleavage/methylation domain-containing protein
MTKVGTVRKARGFTLIESLVVMALPGTGVQYQAVS